MGRQMVVLEDIAVDFSDVPLVYEPDAPVASSHLATITDTAHTPGWARYAQVFCNVLDCSGTTNTVDLAFSYVDPMDKTTTVAYPGSGITQITAAGMVVVHFDPFAADDDTGPIYTLHGAIPPTLSYSLALGTKAENEVQTIDLGDFAATDTFHLTFNSHETGEMTYAADLSSTIQGELEGLADFDAGDLTVTQTSDTVYVVTFGGPRGNADIGAITITNASGFTPTGVTETNKGVVGDETYDINLSIVYSN